MILSTSLYITIRDILRGELQENEVFVISGTRYDSMQNALEDITTFKIMTIPTCEQLSSIQNKLPVDSKEYEKLKAQICAENAIKISEICRNLFSNGQVFQYRTFAAHKDLLNLRKFTRRGKPREVYYISNDYLWRYDNQLGHYVLNVANGSFAYYRSIEKYILEQRECYLTGRGRWLDYLFPTGLLNVEQLKPFATHIE